MIDSIIYNQYYYNNFSINHYKELESTNSLAFLMAKNHKAQHNHIIVADKQTSGRGRMGRSWISSGNNLQFSVILEPKKSANISTQISFIAAIAVSDAIKKLSNRNDIKIHHKWPNDILINNKKVAGILLESDFLHPSDEFPFVILGIGINIDSHPTNISNYPTSNLTIEITPHINKEDFFRKVLDNISILYQKWFDFGFIPIRNLWLEKAFKLDKEITVNLSNKTISGIFKDLDNYGNLLLFFDGKIQKISCGEIF